ncbi:MAG: PQQ-binding-like beta-propeller repeat protein [Planctomycetota bacterium]
MPLARALTPLLVLLAALPATAQTSHEDQWGQWRGPLGTGVAPRADPPVRWSETENVRFKTELPGTGHGSPVVFGDRVFLTAAVPVGPITDPVPDDAPGAHDNAVVRRRHEFVALAVDRASGEIAWRTTLHEQLPHAVFHRSGTLAAASAVTDGEHVIAFFGSYGLYCLDVEGEVVWGKDLGDMSVKHGHGEGATPALFGDTVVVLWDHEGESFIVALDKRTGEERWRVARDEVTSWSTPLVIEHDGAPQVVASGTTRIRSYDLSDGRVVWECVGLSNNVVASPVFGDGIVYAGSSYARKRMVAVRLDGAKGDVTRTDNLLWVRQRGTPYVPSPLLVGEWLYFLNHYQGFLTRVHGPTGAEPARPMRLDGMQEIYASPVAAAGRVYVTDRQGVTLVLSDDAKDPKVLARNVLDESISASAALAGGELYLRGARHLYCIAEPSK